MCFSRSWYVSMAPTWHAGLQSTITATITAAWTSATTHGLVPYSCAPPDTSSPAQVSALRQPTHLSAWHGDRTRDDATVFDLFHLVIGVAELVAARGDILVTHLVYGHGEGCVVERRDELAVLDLIRRG